MRKSNGVCIRKRCPNGTRKDKKTHECVTSSRKRCPNGSRRHKTTQECYKYTPRTNYFQKTKTPMLLGGVDVFQVSYKEGQFENFAPITEHTNVECFIQTLFALRLRGLAQAKKDIERIQGYTHGVLYTEATRYLRLIFGLDSTQLRHVRFDYNSPTSDDLIAGIHTMHKYFDDHLVNNYATIFSVTFKQRALTNGHFLIAYKQNHEVYFFDPQSNYHTQTLFDFHNNKDIIDFGIFLTRNITTTVLKQKNGPIDFYG